MLWCISWLGYLLISLIGRTLRFEWSSEPGSGVENGDPPPVVIGSFWHRAVIPATYYFRDRGMAVITSRSFDGEYIARIIELFGFSAVRGSSSRGGSGALLGMNRVLANGHIAAFTIDGPRGPCYVAKPGPVLLAKMSGVPILCFYLAVERPWLLRSWDRMMVPRPFSKVHVRWTKLIQVPAEAGERRDEAVPPADAGFAGTGAARCSRGAGRAGQLERTGRRRTPQAYWSVSL